MYSSINTPKIEIPNLQIPQYGSQRKIPKIKNTSEAERYPALPDSQDVLLDANDEYVAYFREIDANGFVHVERVRCVPEPEVQTFENVNGDKYVTASEFKEVVSSLKEDMENVRKTIYECFSGTATESRGRNRHRHHAAASGSEGNVQIGGVEQKPGYNVTGNGSTQSENTGINN